MKQNRHNDYNNMIECFFFNLTNINVFLLFGLPQKSFGLFSFYYIDASPFLNINRLLRQRGFYHALIQLPCMIVQVKIVLVIIFLQF